MVTKLHFIGTNYRFRWVFPIIEQILQIFYFHFLQEGLRKAVRFVAGKENSQNVSKPQDMTLIYHIITPRTQQINHPRWVLITQHSLPPVRDVLLLSMCKDSWSLSSLLPDVLWYPLMSSLQTSAKSVPMNNLTCEMPLRKA